MRVVLIGADLEENLGVGMVAAAAEVAGHPVYVVPFDEASQLEGVVERVIAVAPEVVGLSVQFQHRAVEFLALARRLRELGWAGHLTAGGQFPSLAWRELLADRHGVDSVVLFEGEHSFPALLDALERGGDLATVAGLALVDGDGVARRTAPQRLADLDALPFARRYRPHSRHLGVPFVPIMGGRGCWGRCTYCSITSMYRAARRHGGGCTFRQRSPADLADEMASLQAALGRPAIFCFHDDNLLLPRPADSLARMRALRTELDARGVGPVAMVGKCRPDCLTDELALELAALGVIRLYVGVENASEAGASHLGRGRQLLAAHQALQACERARIFTCYNLLVFEPRTTLDHVRANVRFIREHAAHPMNFCRAEAYHGTPLHAEVAGAADLGGSYLGWNYRIRDDRVELLFRVCAAAFRERNFAADGVANRVMGLGYAARVLEAFHGCDDLGLEVDELVRDTTLETAAWLAEAIELVEDGWGDADQVEREAALLGLRIAEADRRRHHALDRIDAAMRARAQRQDPPPRPRSSRPVLGAALGASLAVWATGCDACGPTVVDPAPPDHPVEPDADGHQVVDPPPTVVDPAPPPVVDPEPSKVDPQSKDLLIPELTPTPPPYQVVDPVPEPIEPPLVVDPVPVPIGDPAPTPIADPVPIGDPAPIPIIDPVPTPIPVEPSPADPAPYPILADPPAPPPPTLRDPPPRPVPSEPVPEVDDGGSDAGAAADEALAATWRDTSPGCASRSSDLPLFDPPQVALRHEWRGGSCRVWLEGLPPSVSIRWQTRGTLQRQPEGLRWTPLDRADQLTAAVRSEGGVAVVSLRARRS